MRSSIFNPVTIFTVCLVGFIVILSFCEPIVGDILEYNQAKIRQGEVWRLLTGNFVHFGLYHTVMNVISITLIGLCLFWAPPLWVWGSLVFVIPIFDGLGLFFLSHDIEIYRGYSGAVYGLAFIGLILNWRTNPWIAGVVGAGLWGKLMYERLPNYDVNFLVDKIGVPVAVDAHLWGGISGVVLSVPVYLLLKRINSKGASTQV